MSGRNVILQWMVPYNSPECSFSTVTYMYIGLDVSRKKKRSHEQTGRAASHTQGKLPLQITHAQGDRTRGASAPREEREGREMEGNSRGIVSFCCSFLPTKSSFNLLTVHIQGC